MRLPGTPLAIGLVPQYEIRALPSDGSNPLFESLGTDPQFGVADPGQLARIRPGWWRVRWRLHAHDGWIVTPKLYLNYGRGFSEAESIALREPDADGVSDTIIRVRSQVHGIRLDPTAREAVFASGSLRMRRIGRVRAAHDMLRTLTRDLSERGNDPRGTTWRWLRQLLGPRRTQAAVDLWQTYIDAGCLPLRSYDLWYRMFTPSRARLERRAQAVRARPSSIALVLPSADVAPARLDQTLDSIQNQLWKDWTLWAARPAQREPLALLQARAAGDARIRVVEGPDDALLKQALAHDASLVLMVEPDALLAPHATAEFLLAHEAQPQAQVLYCDSDTIVHPPYRQRPCFKPAWNAPLFAETDYIGPAWAARADHLAAAVAQGTADTWLAAALAELGEHQVAHIPKVLYHRALEQTATADPRPAPIAPVASGPLVSIVIPTRDRVGLLRTCVDSVRGRTRYTDYELVIVDNGSTDPETLAYLDELASQGCHVVRDASPFNFSALVNLGVLWSNGTFVCLLNNDIEVIEPDWLGEMVAQCGRDDVGAVGAQLYYPDGSIQHGGILLGIGGVAGHAHHGMARGQAGYQGRARAAQELSAVTAACMLVRRRAFEEVGGFDEGFPVAFNDVDFCLRLRQAGWRIVFNPRAELTHHESVSRGREDTCAKQARFDSEVLRMRERWGDVLDSDPAYNPNLTLDWTDFSPSFPPRLDLLATQVPSPWWSTRPLQPAPAAGPVPRPHPAATS